MSETKICVVGGGNWGKNHIRTLHEMGKLGAVVELDPQLRESLQSEYPGLVVLDDLDRALSGAPDVPNCAGYVIATPAHIHFPLGMKCLEAGKGVLIEKPMTLDSEEAEKLVAAADSASQVLMVGHLLLFQPAIQFIKEFIEAGKLGEVYTLHQIRAKLGRARAKEDVLWSFGVHDLAVLLYLIGSAPEKIHNMGHCGIQESVADDVHLQMQFADGVQAYLHNSWLWPAVERKLTVVGEKGILVYDELEQNVVFHEKSIAPDTLENIDGNSSVVFEGVAQPLQLELEHFIHCIETSTRPKADGQNGLDVVRILEQAS